MTDEYASRFAAGTLYQDWLVMEMLKRGWVIQTLSSKEYQVRVGESVGGMEIKFDRRAAETKNLYIECAEKSNAANENFVPSGIYRNDNTVLWFIGDRSKVYVIGKKHLRAEHKARRFELRPVKTPTSAGFLLPVERAEELAVWTIEFDQEKQEAA